MTNFTNTALNLQGIAETFESILDDMLVSLSSTQLILSTNGRRSVPVDATINAVKLGQASYIYSIAALNLVIVALFVFKIVRTRGWVTLPKFNYNDLSNVVTAGIGEQAFG
jgi:hypothetical protein